MSDANEAIHAIRNDLSPILFFAEMASCGDREAQKLVIDQLVQRTEAIRAELDVLDAVVKHAKRKSCPKGNSQAAKCLAEFKATQARCSECGGERQAKD